MSEYGSKKTYTPGNFFDDLDKRIDNKEEATNTKTDRKKLIEFISGDKFMATAFPEQAWLVDGIIPDKGMVCLSGMPSSYKSWFGFYMALCIMRGKPILEDPVRGFAGWKTEKGSILFIDKENVEKQIQNRMKMLGAGEEMKNCYFAQGNFTTENLNSLAEIVQFVKEKKIKMVIIDSLIRVHSRNENDAVEMSKVFERLTEIQYAGAAVMYIHHLRKQTNYGQDAMERLRGSIDLAARLDSLIAFENDEKNIIRVSHGKSRYGKAFPAFVMRFETDQHNKAFFNYEKELDPGEIEQMFCIDAVFSLLQSNSYLKKHLVEKLGSRYTESAIEAALADLYKDKKINRNRVGKEMVYSKNPLYNFTQTKLTEEEKEDLN